MPIALGIGRRPRSAASLAVASVNFSLREALVSGHGSQSGLEFQNETASFGVFSVGDQRA